MSYVPVWDHQREGRLSDTMLQEMAYLKTDLDRQVANQTSGGIMDPLTLGSREGFGFFQSPGFPGVLAFVPSPQGTGFTLQSTQLDLQSLNGVSQEGLQSYQSFSGGVAATGVAQLVSLKLRLGNPMAAGTGAVAPHEATVRLDVADAANRCVAQLFLRISGPAAGPRSIQVNVYPGQSNNCTASFPATPAFTRDTTIGCGSCIAPAYVHVDALEPALQFQALVTAGQGPFTLTFTMTGSPAPSMSRILTYDKVVPGGTSRVGGGGYVVNNYATTVSAGTLSLRKENQRFPAQTMVLEYGAVLIAQGSSAVMAIPPTFRVSSTSSQARLDWIVPALTGTANEVGGAPSAAVTSTPAGGRSQIDAMAPRVTFTLSTTYGKVWTDYWSSQFANAGFVAGTHFVASYTATTATTTLYGPVSGAADATKDILVNVAAAPLTITIAAT